MHLGSIYLVVNDFEKSVAFYEGILEMPVSAKNMTRFAQFRFEGHNISLMNGHFDAENPDKVTHEGSRDQALDDMQKIALAPNTHKFVLNFWDEDLRREYEHVKNLHISEFITPITCVDAGSPYYYFQLTDPDGNILEVTGDYEPQAGEFDS